MEFLTIDFNSQNDQPYESQEKMYAILSNINKCPNK